MCEAGCDCMKVVCEYLPVKILSRETGPAAGILIQHSHMQSSTRHDPATFGVL
jgi:hypothetical protein